MQFEKPTAGRIALSILSIVLLIGAIHSFREALSHKKGGIEEVGGEYDADRRVWIDSPAYQRHMLVNGIMFGFAAFVFVSVAWVKKNADDSE